MPELLAKVLTVSDGVVAGTREDKSGDALVATLTEAGFTVAERRVVGDGIESVGLALTDLCDGFAGLVVTTGGTGFGPRDLTPEGTKTVIDREAPGLAEAMRLVSPLGRLSRAVAGTRDEALDRQHARVVGRGGRDPGRRPRRGPPRPRPAGRRPPALADRTRVAVALGATAHQHWERTRTGSTLLGTHSLAGCSCW